MQATAGDVGRLLAAQLSVQLTFAQIPWRGNDYRALVALQEQQRPQRSAVNIVQQFFIPVRLDQLGNDYSDDPVFVFALQFANEL